MLHSLLPKAYHKFLAMRLLGPITDGFDDWLTANGYTPGSREFAIRMLPHIDADLRRRRVRDVASLTHATLHACWRDLMKDTGIWILLRFTHGATRMNTSLQG